VNNFDAQQSLQTRLSVPHDVLEKWDLPVGDYIMKDLLNSGLLTLRVTDKGGIKVGDNPIHARFSVNLAPLDSAVFEITWSTPIAQ
jgi:hypothetical protein